MGQIQINLRVPAELRAQLQEAASARDVSVNREINDRLLRSFEMAADDRLRAILNAASIAMETAGTHIAAMRRLAGHPATAHWSDDPAAFEQAKQAVLAILEEMAPAGDAALPKFGNPPSTNLDIDAVHESFGRFAAQSVLREISDDEAVSTTAPVRGPKLRANLGTEIVARIKSRAEKRS